MSLKPKKISEIKKEQDKLNEKMKKKNKTILDDIPPYTFIVSEGTKTEVTYIAGFASAINKKYASFTTGEMIKIKGTGRNCQSLLEYARKVVEDEMPQASIVWLMYDKDQISRAKKQYASYPASTPASQRCPATKVFELVEELKKYL